MPSWELFEEQDADRDLVLLPSVGARVTVEEAAADRLGSLCGTHGVVLGMHTFGMSAPIKVVMEHFGFTVEHVVAAAKQAMDQANRPLAVWQAGKKIPERKATQS